MTLQTLFSLVLSIALQAGVVGLVLLCVRQLMRRWLPAKWVCLLWLVLLCKLLFPFGPESALSLFNAAPEPVREAITAPSVPHQMQTAQQQVISAAPVEGIPAWQTAAAWIWLAGAAALLLWLLATRLMLAYRLHRTGHSADARLQRLLEDCRIRIGVPQPVELVIQNAVAAPSLLGLRRPKILLSAHVADMPDKTVCYILLHELSHIKRCDPYLNALLLALRTIFWFQPVLWLCFRLLRQDIELATDERVLQTIGSAERTAYGESLLDTLHQMTAAPAAPRLLGLVNDKHSLKERLRQIARFRKSTLARALSGMAAVILLSSVCLTSAKTMLPDAAVSLLEPQLPSLAAMIQPEPVSPEPPVPVQLEQAEQPEQPEQQEQPAQPTEMDTAVPETTPAEAPVPDTRQEAPAVLPEQTLKPDAPSAGITTQLYDLLPGTSIPVLEQYMQEEGRTAGADGCDLADSYYKGQYTLNAQTPAASVSVAADQNGAITYLTDNNLGYSIYIQVIDPETNRRMCQSSTNSDLRWAESFVGLQPGKAYTLQLVCGAEIPTDINGTLIVY